MDNARLDYDGKEPPYRLSPAERQLLQGLADGYTAQQLATMRGTSYRTVHNQLVVVQSKLQVQGITQAVVHAWVLGWID